LGYKIFWHEDVLKDLKKIDNKITKKIINKIKGYLSKDPISLGKQLKGNFLGMYRYRIGAHRIIYIIDEENKFLKILRIGLRKDIYKKI